MKTTFSTILITICFGLYSQSESRYYTDSIYSKSLGEYRKMNIYLPPGYLIGQQQPVIYATDGLGIEEHSVHPTRDVIDSLIRNKLMKPVILVESHCNLTPADTYTLGDGTEHYFTRRNYEYAEKNAQENPDTLLSQLFNRHLIYFSEELVQAVETKLLLSTDQDDRWFYGFSNGGAFGIGMMYHKPLVFGNYLCFSPMGFETVRVLKYYGSRPNAVIAYGSEEAPYMADEIDECANSLRNIDIKCEVKIYVGGHNQQYWKLLLASSLVKKMPAKRR